AGSLKRRLLPPVRARASASSRFRRTSRDTGAVPGLSRPQTPPGLATCFSKTSNSRAGPSSPVIHLSSLFKASVCGSANISENSEIAARNRRSATLHMGKAFAAPPALQGLLVTGRMQEHPAEVLHGALHFESEGNAH